MNEETIIKALEVCPTSRCSICPLRKRVDCRDLLVREALKIIRSKMDELNQATEQLTAAECKIGNLRETMVAVVEQHKIIVKDLMEQMNNTSNRTEEEYEP